MHLHLTNRCHSALSRVRTPGDGLHRFPQKNVAADSCRADPGCGLSRNGRLTLVSVDATTPGGPHVDCVVLPEAMELAPRVVPNTGSGSLGLHPPPQNVPVSLPNSVQMPSQRSRLEFDFTWQSPSTQRDLRATRDQVLRTLPT